jgi:hypothetical protein
MTGSGEFRIVAWLLVLGVAAAVAAGSAAAASSPRVFRDAQTVMSLGRVTTSPVRLLPSRDPADPTGGSPLRVVDRTVEFNLPAKAEQGGPSGWYILDFSADLSLASSQGNGFAWISVATNDRTAVQLEYTVEMVGGTPVITESAVGLVDGSQKRYIVFPGGRIHQRNFLQLRGIRGGRNRITFRLEETGAVHVESVDILGQTRIFLTRHSPYPLRLSVRSPGRISVGSEFRLAALLRGELGETVRAVKVTPEFDKTRFRLISRKEIRVSKVGGVRPEKVEFVFRALRQGAGDITILATSQRNHPHKTVRIAVGASSAGSGSRGWIIPLGGLGVGLGVLGIGLAISSRRRLPAIRH